MRRLAATLPIALTLVACGGSEGARPDPALRRAATPVAPRHALHARPLDLHGEALRSLPVVRGVTALSRIDPYLSRLAAVLSRRDAEVDCWSRRDWRRAAIALRSGAVIPGAGGRVHLPAEECNRLDAFAVRPADVRGRPRIELAVSVMAFAHDVQHLAGDRDEIAAECHAMQRAASIAARLGAPFSLARGLAQLYWTQIYPRSPAAYRSAECRDGGRLDLHPESRDWP